MVCNKCGTENMDIAKFCKGCGNRLQVNTQETQLVNCQPENPQPVKYQQYKKEEKEPKRTSKTKGKQFLVYAILLIVVAMISKNKVNKCIEEIAKNRNMENDSHIESGTGLEVEELEELTKDIPMVEGLYEETDKPRNPEMVKAFTNAYGGVWYLTKEYNSDDREWSYRDLKKKLAIMAWNRFNDYSYQEIEGSYLRDRGELGYYYKGRWVCVEDLGYETELIYGDWVHADGIDIKYHEEYIVLTDNEVDLTGIGGPIFSIEDFRYENIYGYDYLISDIYGFGLVWDGTYLEYCEPKEDNGYHQGLYAFRHFSMDSIINQDYNDD